MKYSLLALVLALSGCYNIAVDNKGPVPLPEPPSVDQTTLGFNDNGDVSYACMQAEVTPALVWDECHFHNFAASPKEMCITVSYQWSGETVSTSREICSGLVNPGETKENYSAFTPKTDRKKLEDYCGLNMIHCKLTAKVIK